MRDPGEHRQKSLFRRLVFASIACLLCGISSSSAKAELAGVFQWTDAGLSQAPNTASHPTVIAAGCTYNISPTGMQTSAAATNGAVGISTQSGCDWSATSNASWLTLSGSTSGTGSGSVSFAIAQNAGAARQGTLTVAGKTFTVDQDACAYSINPTSINVSAAAAIGGIAITATSGCDWNASSNDNWITITAGQNGTGSGNASYAVAANNGAGRTGTLTVAGKTFTVTQSACQYNINPAIANVGAETSNLTVGVTTTAACPWNATSNDGWVTITAGNNGIGNGTTSLTIGANNGDARSGTATIAGKTFTVNQAGCAYLIAPVTVNPGAAGSSGTVYIGTTSGCPWTSVSNDGWITITAGNSGTGSALTFYSVAANTGPARSGTATIAQQTFTVNQGGCSYSIQPTSKSVGAAATSGAVTVTAPSGCSWTATSNTAWITITSGGGGSGNGAVGYSVAANTGASRTGTAVIAGQTFTVSQEAGSCSYSIAPTGISAGPAATNGSIAVTAPAGCSWTSSSNASWIQITGGSSGTGNGTVSYAVLANTGVARTGTATIAGQTFTVSQSAASCTYSIAPTHIAPSSSSTTGSVTVTAPSGCNWSASSNSSWITITSGTSGTGNGVVYYSIAANSGAARTGSALIAGQTFSVQQSGSSPRSVPHDFDGDGKSDVLWRQNTGKLSIWKMNGVQGPIFLNAGSATTDWQIVGTGDFDGDGKADILWRQNGGAVAVWLMDGGKIKSSKTVGSATSDWTIAGTGDFDGDGKTDILWHQTSTGKVAIWKMDGTNAPTFLNPGYATTDWQIAGVGDFDGDGTADIVWRNTNGHVAVWLMQDGKIKKTATVGTATSDWTIAGTGDFDGDGKADILWHQTSTGKVVIWKMNGVQSPVFLNAGSATTVWQIAGTGDFDGDGTTDILWRNSNGQVAVWLMNGAHLTTAKTIGSATTAWQIQPE